MKKLSLKRIRFEKNQIQTIASFLPAFVLAVAIFVFSAQAGAQSTQTSTAVGRFIIGCYMDVSGVSMSADMIESRAFAIDEIVRKSAHMLEYAIFTVSLCIPFLRLFRKRESVRPLFATFLHSFLLAAVYAASDEIHQIFVPGRCGCIKDVLIDSAGALLGTIFFAILIFPSLKKK